MEPLMENYSRAIENKQVDDVVLFRGLGKRETRQIRRHFPNVGTLMKATEEIFSKLLPQGGHAAARMEYVHMMRDRGIQIRQVDRSFDHLLKLHKQRAVIQHTERK